MKLGFRLFLPALLASSIWMSAASAQQQDDRKADRTSKTNQLTTIETVTIDGEIFVSIKTGSTKVVARSLTLEGTPAPLAITATPQGLEMKNGSMMLISADKVELQANLRITKLDLISLEISAEGK